MELPTELRHTYRALLRAATYLPDSAARAYIHSHVVRRFRAVSHSINTETKPDSVQRANRLARYHGTEHIASLRRNANQLERAGLGSGPDLKKVLLLTHGRVGKRRRQLLADLLMPEESHLPGNDASLEKFISKPDDMPIRYPPHSKFGSLLRSQIQNPLARDRYRIRSTKPDIPEENIWYRPTPRKLVLSMKRKWWAETLDKLLPPVPSQEWNRLRDLISGAIPIEDMPLRRALPASSFRLLGHENDMRLLEYFTVPVNKQKLDLDGITIDEEGVACWVTTRSLVTVRHKDHRTFRARSMQRLYADILSLTPTMWQDPVTKVWSTRWGDTMSADVMGPRQVDEELFVGAEKMAKCWKQQKGPRQQRKQTKGPKGLTLGPEVRTFIPKIEHAA